MSDVKAPAKKATAPAAPSAKVEIKKAEPVRTLMAIAKDMDAMKKKITKAESVLNAVEKQMAALDIKKKDAMGDIGDLDEAMDKLKAEYEEVMNG